MKNMLTIKPADFIEERARMCEELFTGKRPEAPSAYVLDVLMDIYELGFYKGWMASPSPEAKKASKETLRDRMLRSRGRTLKPAEQGNNLIDSDGNLVLF